MTDLTQSSEQNIATLGCTQQPFVSELWQGRAEPHESERAKYWYQVVQAHQASVNTPIGLLGFACDQGVRRNLGRVGAKNGPQAIRKALAKLPISASLQNIVNDSHDNPFIADRGDVICHDSDKIMSYVLEKTQIAFAEQVTKIITQHHQNLAIGLGGGHAIAYASYLGLWHALHPNDESTAKSIGILNFDAHLDIRQAPAATSGTPFRQIAEHNQSMGHPFHYGCIGVSQFANTAALFDRATSLGVTIISDDDCYRLPWPTIASVLDQFIAQVDSLYITIDMDCFPASVVPGVSAPAAKGITLDFVERCLSVLMATGKVKVLDIAELNPVYDIDEHSAKIAARLLALVIEQHLLTQ